MEDVFEAFTAVTEMFLDKKYGLGVGYRYCYVIISRLLDELKQKEAMLAKLKGALETEVKKLDEAEKIKK